MKKLENLINFDDFKSSWKEEKAKKTKRTDTGLDILKENIEEIVPEGLPDEGLLEPVESENYVEDIIKSIDDVDNLEHIINYLRDTLTEMEQQGFITEEETDELDDRHDSIDKEWIIDVINLENIPEEALRGVLEIVNGGQVDNEYQEDDDDLGDWPEDVTCPDCDGDGVDENGEECERCEGEGSVDRPFDIPPD